MSLLDRFDDWKMAFELEIPFDKWTMEFEIAYQVAAQQKSPSESGAS